MISASNNTVRVRFAPSPTGDLHTGNVRTALLNWVYARQQGGRFILRIEDTDIERSVEGSEARIMDDLRWLGLDWDEGPDTGGDVGPYKQSERTELHREYTQRLLKEGRAYRCYCSEAELEAAREKALAEGEQPRYNGKCRELTYEKEEKKKTEGIPPTVRFMVPEGQRVFDDLIRGEISWDLSNIGDFVLLRSNGMPSYNFAVVLDDALMEITHVIRGDGHISNTPRQLLVYEALGFDKPAFAHTATILNREKKTLSKRHGAVTLRRYREEGYLPEALINYLSLLSWSSESGDDILSLERIVSEFSFDRMSSSAAVFDDEKLLWMNGRYIRSMPEDELVDSALQHLKAAGFPAEKGERTTSVMAAVRDNLSKLSDVAEYARVFYDEGREPETEDEAVLLHAADSQRIFSTFLTEVEEIDVLNEDEFRGIMKRIQEKTGLKGKELWMPMRVGLTGRSHGPELPRIVEFFGKEKVLSRIRKAADLT